ncbi:hypothetical protein FKG94_22345 [Exilibacterium tricleocarpae]|uniref:Porin n=1 Tax=Exilibacterium tricleocarpae TaxID=2591008 RepID=A0A545SY50_9GAMM|nr:hypothetical protein [Exilibacterium tricleocarpae]TQV69896.1 hypothetical protein FKG94_22345 [Exilibacterium tricleocarpae]
MTAIRTFISLAAGFAAVLMLCGAGVCRAGGIDLPDNLRVHGFAAQGFVQSDHNNFFGDSEDGSWDFYELGINALWRPTGKLKLALQLTMREAGATDDGDLRVDYGFVDYTLFSTDAVSGGVRLGRVVNPLGFYNDTRDIAATRPSIFLPQSIYFDIHRNFALSSDGVHFYYERGADSGDYLFQFGVFEPRTQDPDFEPAIFLEEVPGNLEGATSWMGRFVYEYDFGRVRLGLTASEVNVDYEPGGFDPLAAGEFHFRPLILSVQYNAERWGLTTEVARRTSQLDGFGDFADAEFTGTNYFIQGTYRPRPGWELLLRYDELIWDNDDKNGRRFEATRGLPHYSRFAKDWTIGVRWDITRHVMLRAEWHQVDGTAWLSTLENPVPRDTRRHWDLFAFSAAVRF